MLIFLIKREGLAETVFSGNIYLRYAQILAPLLIEPVFFYPIPKNF